MMVYPQAKKQTLSKFINNLGRKTKYTEQKEEIFQD